MKIKTDMKQKLRNHELCIGTHVSLGEAIVTEMMGNLDYDYLWIDMEHSCINTDQLINHLIAARASGINALVRIPWNDPVLAKPVMDSGADGIIFPMVRNYDEACRAVEASSYPPRGIRGYGPRRAAMFGMIDGRTYRAHADENLMRFIQIEHIDAVNDLDRILTIPELDAFILGPNDLSGSMGRLGADENLMRFIQIEHIDAVNDLDRILTIPELDAFILGPNDLSGSMGRLGEFNAPDVRAIIDEAIAKINAAGKVAGVSLGAADADTLKDWYNRGARMISSGYDVKYIMAGAKANLAAMRQSFGMELGAADADTLKDWYNRGARMISSGYDVKYIMAGAKANLAAMRQSFGME